MLSFVFQDIPKILQDKDYFMKIKGISNLLVLWRWLGWFSYGCSTIGYCVLLGGNIFYWKAKKQMLLHDHPLEYKVVMTSLTRELIWVKQFLQELYFCEIEPMKIYCDNQAAIPIASNPVFHERTKHWNWLSFYSRKVVVQGNLHWNCQIKYQLADVLTKSLRGPLFQAWHIQFVCSRYWGSVRLNSLKHNLFHLRFSSLFPLILCIWFI